MTGGGAAAGQVQERSGTEEEPQRDRCRSGTEVEPRPDRCRSGAGQRRSRSGTGAGAGQRRSRDGTGAGAERDRGGAAAGQVQERDRGGAAAGQVQERSGTGAGAGQRRTRSGTGAGAGERRSRGGTAAGAGLSRPAAKGIHCQGGGYSYKHFLLHRNSTVQNQGGACRKPQSPLCGDSAPYSLQAPVSPGALLNSAARTSCSVSHGCRRFHSGSCVPSKQCVVLVNCLATCVAPELPE